jgi:3-hydroxyacyl-[acyl-carrier-protein] dehydratase
MSEPGETPLDHLPHGPEFRFLDRVTEIVPGKSGRGEYLVRGDEPFLKGHFPGEPIFPGVLLVEAAAQLAGVVVQAGRSEDPLEGLKLTAVRQAKILGTARPGEMIVVRATIDGAFENLVQASATADVHERRVLEAYITLSADKRAG